MPRGDGTGPMGQGPMTGRGLGYCAGYPQPGFMHPSFGRGFGRGWGRGFGRGRGFRWRRFYRYPVEPIRLTKDEQRKILEEEKKELELEVKAIHEEMEAIQKKLKELK